MADNAGQSSCESDPHESDQLHRSDLSVVSRERKRCACISSYRLIKIPGKGAVFMILFNFLFATTLVEVAIPSKSYCSTEPSTVWMWAAATLLFPIFGLISDTYFGRYKFLTASLYLWLISITFMALEVIIPSEALHLLHYAARVVSIGCYISCAIPFTIDQVVGASGEELSFTIYWILWPWITFANVINILPFILPESVQMRQIVVLALISLSFISAYLMSQCCSHVLMTKPQLSNPIKLMARVLNYARKHKFPERRSAFTYWEEECPSRIDLGKDKYGGPFTVEEVENVKTVFKLIPLISCVSGILLVNGSFNMDYLLPPCETIRFYFTLLQAVVITTWLPAYHLLLYPFLYNYVPSMLRRIGIGLFVVVLSYLFNFIIFIVYVGHGSYLGNTSLAHVLPKNEQVCMWLTLSSLFIRNVSACVVVSVTVEFCMAQAPCQVRGLVSTVFVFLCGIVRLVNLTFYHTIHVPWVLYTVRSVVLVVFIVLFALASKWYKLRKRDDVIPYHMFAEDQFETNYRQEHNWRRKEELFESLFVSDNESRSVATNP